MLSKSNLPGERRGEERRGEERRGEERRRPPSSWAGDWWVEEDLAGGGEWVHLVESEEVGQECERQGGWKSVQGREGTGAGQREGWRLCLGCVCTCGSVGEVCMCVNVHMRSRGRAVTDDDRIWSVAMRWTAHLARGESPGIT